MSDSLNTRPMLVAWIPVFLALLFFSSNAFSAIEFSPDWNAYGHCTTLSARNTCAWSWTVSSRHDTTCDYPFTKATSMPFHFRSWGDGVRMEVQFGSTNLNGMVTDPAPQKFYGDDSYLHHIPAIETFYPAYMECQIDNMLFASLSGSVAQPVSFTGSCYWSQRDLYGGGVCSGTDEIVAKKLPPGFIEIPPDEPDPDKNLDIVAIEVNQSVQDWANSAPLIANKSTIVRAYVQTRVSNGPYAKGVAGQLYGFNATTGQALSPPTAGRSGAIAPPQADLFRALTEFNMNFKLPDSWLQGQVRLVLKSGNASYIFNCGGYTTTLDDGCATVVTFQTSAIPKIKFIGIQWEDDDGKLYTPTRAQATDLIDSLKDAYPVADVNATYASMYWPFLGKPVLDEVNASLLELKRQDCSHNLADCQRIYYGFIPGYWVGGLASDIGGEVASGVMPQRKFTIGWHTHLHEIGHMLSRHHSVNSVMGSVIECVTPSGEYYELTATSCYPGDVLEEVYKLGFCGSMASMSEAPDFPYTNNINDLIDELFGHYAGYPWPTLGLELGGTSNVVFGYDFNSKKYGYGAIVDPRDSFDLMSYCRSQYSIYDRWPSLYTYNNLYTRINALWPVTTANAVPTTPIAAAAAGVDYIDVVGNVAYPSGAVNILYIEPITLTGDLPIPPTTGLYTLRLQNQLGEIIQDIPFDLIKQHGSSDTKTAGIFVVPVAVNPDIAKISIQLGDVELAARSASSAPPNVEVVYPNGGESITDDTIKLSWTASDADNDTLQYTIQFSADNGLTWQTLNIGWNKTNIDIDRHQLQKTSQGLIRVIASDGFYSTGDTSDAVFSINGSAPQLIVEAPLGNPLIAGEQLLDAKVNVWDAEDVAIPEANIKWISNIDGEIGSGSAPQFKADTLSEGQHYITITASDSDNNLATANSRMLVWRNEPALYTDLVIIVYEYPKPLAPNEEGSYTLMIINDGPAVADPVYLFDYLATGAVVTTATVDSSVTCQGHDDFMICGLGEMLVDEVQFIKVGARANQQGEILGIGVVTGMFPDLFLLNNRTLSEFGAEPTVDLNLTATATVTDNNIQYTYSLVNNGREAATAINMTSPVLTENFGLLSASNDCSAYGYYIKCGYGILFPGEQAKFTVNTQAKANGDYSISASVTTLELDTNFNNNQANTTFQISGIKPQPGNGGGSGDSGGGGGGGCFIATAAYGSPMMEDVRYLRAFRDEYLLTNQLGSKVVEWYYKLSPPLADFIRQDETLRSFVRNDLKPLVFLSRYLVSEDILKRQTKDRP